MPPDDSYKRFVAAIPEWMMKHMSPREQDILRLGFTYGVLDESNRILEQQKFLRMVPICRRAQ